MASSKRASRRRRRRNVWIWRDIIRLCTRVKRLRDRVLRPLTPEEAEIAAREAPEVPLTTEEIDAMVRRATGSDS